MKAVIMAGGEGSRLRPLTSNQPKPLMPIANRPMMEHVIDLLRQHGITEIVVTLAFMPDAIRQHFGDGSDYGVSLEYVVEREPLGTAGSVRNAAHLLDDTFLVISGDVLTDINLTEIIDFHLAKEAMVTIGLTPVANPLEFGIVITRPDGSIERFLEKPTWGQVFSDTVNTGIFVVDPAVLDEVAEDQQVDFSSDVFPKLLADGAPLYGAIAEGYWEDVGTLDSYLRAHHDVLDRTVVVDVPGFSVRAGVWLGEGADVHPDAVIEGPAVLGDNCRVEAGVRLGPYTVLGNDVRVRAGVDLERVVLLDHCFVGRGAQMRGTVAGRSCDFRDNARVETGAVLGDDCFVGEGAMLNAGVRVFAGKEVEAGAVVNTSIVWESRVNRSLFSPEGVSGLANVDLTPELSARLAMAWASTMRIGDSVVVSRDTSRSARMLKRAAMAGLNAAGINVIDLEARSVPVSRLITSSPEARAGMTFRLDPVDADRAVIRFFDDAGLDLDANMQRKVERVLQRQDFRRVLSSEMGDIDVPSRALERYSVALSDIVNLKEIQEHEFKVVVDYSHGSMAAVLPDVLGKLGADVLGVNPYASTPGVIRQDLAAQSSQVSDLVRTSGADLGIVIDPAGERARFIDDHGSVLGDVTAALVYLALLRDTGAYTAVLPVNAPSLASSLVQSVDGRVVPAPLATSAMQKLAVQERAGVGLNFEGGYMFPAFLPAFDAAAAFVVMLQLLARSRRRLSEVAADLPEVHLAVDTIPTPWEAKGQVMRRLIEKSSGRTQVLLDGVKLLHDDGWVLCLPDPAQPVTRIWAEASTDRAAQQLVDTYGRRVRQLAR